MQKKHFERTDNPVKHSIASIVATIIIGTVCTTLIFSIPLLGWWLIYPLSIAGTIIMVASGIGLLLYYTAKWQAFENAFLGVSLAFTFDKLATAYFQIGSGDEFLARLATAAAAFVLAALICLFVTRKLFLWSVVVLTFGLALYSLGWASDIDDIQYANHALKNQQNKQ